MLAAGRNPMLKVEVIVEFFKVADKVVQDNQANNKDDIKWEITPRMIIRYSVVPIT